MTVADALLSMKAIGECLEYLYSELRHLLYGEEVKWPYKKKGTVCMDKE